VWLPFEQVPRISNSIALLAKTTKVNTHQTCYMPNQLNFVTFDNTVLYCLANFVTFDNTVLYCLAYTPPVLQS